MQKKCRCLLIFVYSFILIISSMVFIGVGPIVSNSLIGTQHTTYLLSQDNQTEFGNFSYDRTATYSPSAFPGIQIDVVDQEGVAMVWLSYKRSNESQWSNQSMPRSPALGENRYSGSFRVTVSEYATEFDIKFFANDSLGHEAESEVYQLVIHYNPGDSTPSSPPSEYDLFLPLVAVTISIFAVSLIVIALKVKDRKEG